jgi:hypothetical protein
MQLAGNAKHAPCHGLNIAQIAAQLERGAEQG